MNQVEVLLEKIRINCVRLADRHTRNHLYYKANLENNPDKYKEKAECVFCKKNRNKFNMARHHKSCKSKPKEEN